MRAHLTAALKRRKSDEGFSLIELIVVVAILGILVAIAIPVFGGIQATAAQNARKTIAANAATQIAATIAADATATVTAANLANLENDETTLTIHAADASAAALTVDKDNVDGFCVKATSATDTTKFAWGGPQCAGADAS